MTNPSLQQQLLARVAHFQKAFPTITQAEIARYCGIGEANFSAAIAGRRGLSADSCLQLHKLLTLPKNQVMAKFHGPSRTSTITSFQFLGKKMQLDTDGWVPGLSGTDPNNSTTIDDTPDADTSVTVEATVATLRQVRSIHRKAIKAINNWIVNADVRSKVNRSGTTPVNTTARFNATRILNCLRFAKNDSDTTDAVQTLVDALSTLKDSQRREVLSAIIQAFK
jgi:hypothetical protein